MEEKQDVIRERIENKLKTLPELPGVYLMKNSENQVIYVGKAINLRNRVRSYFRHQPNEAVKTKVLVRHITDFEFVIVDTETEALILESTLIKKYKPKYNINLKDDKSYPYVRITNETFPRVFITRHVVRDGSSYFGPYPNVYELRSSLEVLQRIFKFRKCANTLFNKHEGCLYMHIDRCDAPCLGKISQAEYQKQIDGVRRFFQGHEDNIIRALQEKMQQAAEAMDFEEAAIYRDELAGMKRIIEKQKSALRTESDRDVVAMARHPSLAVVQVFFVRRGRILGREAYPLKTTAGEQDDEVLASFLKQFYLEQEQVPQRIDLDRTVSDTDLLAEHLTKKHGYKVRFHVPQRGEARALVLMVEKNAKEDLVRRDGQKEREEERIQAALEELQESLDLPTLPRRIECYDISNTQGTNSVASMVVFINGRPQSRLYRRFKIKTIEGPNDFLSMEEVIQRRFKRAKDKDPKWSDLPDLVLIDGGKGQLRYTRSAMRDLGFADIPTFSIAEKENYLFQEGRSLPIALPRDAQSLYLLQRVRDESHRFAITYHRSLRGKKQLASVLDDIPGIGPKRKENLLTHFGSFSKIERAEIEELAEVPGISLELAETVYHYLKEHQDLQARIRSRQNI